MHSSNLQSNILEDDDMIPDWKDANFSQKAILIAHYIFIYGPVFVLYGIISVSYVVYLSTYIWCLIYEFEDESELPDYWFYDTNDDTEVFWARFRGLSLLIFTTWSFFWIIFSATRAILTNPGNVPDVPGWKLHDTMKTSSALLEGQGQEGEQESFVNSAVPSPEKFPDPNAIVYVERKKGGGMRNCEHCLKQKPDRCHHCRLCDKCILKMDHHCPWIANCVGFYNHKFFLLTLIYGVLALTAVVGSYWEAVRVWVKDEDTEDYISFLVVVFYTLISILWLVVTLFFFFHCYLIYNAYTTIEFCEKKRNNSSLFSQSPFKISTYQNFLDIFGDNPLLWFFPFNVNNQGYGLVFKIDEKYQEEEEKRLQDDTDEPLDKDLHTHSARPSVGLDQTIKENKYEEYNIEDAGNQ